MDHLAPLVHRLLTPIYMLPSEFPACFFACPVLSGVVCLWLNQMSCCKAIKTTQNRIVSQLTVEIMAPVTKSPPAPRKASSAHLLAKTSKSLSSSSGRSRSPAPRSSTNSKSAGDDPIEIDDVVGDNPAESETDSIEEITDPAKHLGMSCFAFALLLALIYTYRGSQTYVALTDI